MSQRGATNNAGSYMGSHCALCGQWVSSGMGHACSSNKNKYQYPAFDLTGASLAIPPPVKHKHITIGKLRAIVADVMERARDNVNITSGEMLDIILSLHLDDLEL